MVREKRFSDLGGPEHEDGEPRGAEAAVARGAGIVVLGAGAEAGPARVGVAEAAGSKKEMRIKKLSVSYLYILLLLQNALVYTY